MAGPAARATRVHPTILSLVVSNAGTATTLEGVTQVRSTSQFARARAGTQRHMSSNTKAKYLIKQWSSETLISMEELVGEFSPFLTIWAQTQTVRRRLRQRRTYSWNHTSRTNSPRPSTSAEWTAMLDKTNCVKWLDTSTTKFRKTEKTRRRNTNETRLSSTF